jgi:predicted outer membrane protein
MNVTTPLLVVLFAMSAAAFGKMPPPTPDEQAAAAKKKEQQQAQLEKQKKSLEQAQDRVVAHYRKEKDAAPGGRSGQVTDQIIPKTTKELPRGVGPKPDQPQSAEAHSGSAK